MAGNYDDPLPRLHYDDIGVRCWTQDADELVTSIVENDTFLQNMNNEMGGSTDVITLPWSTVTNPGHSIRVLIRFPWPVDIDGMLLIGGTEDISVAMSNNTTNGTDGTWTAGNDVARSSSSLSLTEWSRTTPVEQTALNDFRWLRITGETGATSNKTFGKLLLFGTINNSATGPDSTGQLAYWDDTLDVEMDRANFEFGDSSRGTSQTRTFRIKNAFGAYTAETIQIVQSIVSDGSPSITNLFTLSDDDITYTSSLSIANLAAGAISPVLYLKQDLPSDAHLGLWWIRLTTTAGTWS